MRSRDGAAAWALAVLLVLAGATPGRADRPIGIASAGIGGQLPGSVPQNPPAPPLGSPVERPTPPTPPPAPPVAAKNRLGSGETLGVGQGLQSKSGRFVLKLQPDGNLVLYDAADGNREMWSSRTYRKAVSVLYMQPDGNLVLYDSELKALWASNTRQSAEGGSLMLQDDGNLVIYTRNESQAVWSSGTRQ